MPYSYTEKKRVRRSFAKTPSAVEAPALLKLQVESFRDFLQAEAHPDRREPRGLQNAFLSIFPMRSTNGLVSLEFERYELREPLYDMAECKERGLTYKAPIDAKIRMEIRERGGHDAPVKEARGESVFMGEMPLMTGNGSFIINGTERVVVSQLHRSPGALFIDDEGRELGGKNLYSARVIPYNGRWLDFEFDKDDLLYYRVDRRKKRPVTILLKALGYSREDIVREFHDFENFRLGDAPGQARYLLREKFLRDSTPPFDVMSADGQSVLAPGDQRLKKADLLNIFAGRTLSAEKGPDGASEMDAMKAMKPEAQARFFAQGERWHPVDDSFLIGRWLGKTVANAEGEIAVDAEGKILAPAGEQISEELLRAIRESGARELEAAYTNDVDCGAHILRTLAKEIADLKTDVNTEGARTIIYRDQRPGDPPNSEVVEALFDRLFFNSGRFDKTKDSVAASYDLSDVGRMKFNHRIGPETRPEKEFRVLLTGSVSETTLRALVGLGADADEKSAGERLADLTGEQAVAENLTRERAEEIQAALEEAGTRCEIGPQTTLSRADILSVVRRLVDIRNGQAKADDVDSLANRRVRAVGEFIENQFRQGLMRVERAIRDRMSRAETDELMPSALISAKAVSSSISEFFNGNQLSQFMDQTNPLAEITHKRRVSAFGAGGMTRERAGFEVRDVHATHYGRICPVETPEGPNIGLIGSLAMYAQVNKYGFLQTPYRKVENGRVTGEIERLSAIEERGRVIAQAGARLGADGRILDDFVFARRDKDSNIPARPGEVDYMDVAPPQIASVAASLLPFLEHDDANRALMGSNMQRQGVPCVRPEKPLVGTGVERRVAADSGSVVRARRGGTVDRVDSARVVVTVNADEHGDDEAGVDIYAVAPHSRSNQNTNLGQRPIVREGDRIAAGDIIADGSATDLGELALGQNVLVAFLPWNGYNFEDSILVSERVVADDRYASIHIIEEEVHARDTKLGPEEITRDIPNQPETALVNLDDTGVIYVGTEVFPEDILVGKVTPKGEQQLTPEEKLLRAVFGDKAADVKDTSLRMPPGSAGVVIDVQVFTSEELKRKEKEGSVPLDIRAKEIRDEELAEFKKNQEDTLRIVRDDAVARIRRIASGKTLARQVGGLKRGDKLRAADFDSLRDEQVFRVSLQEEAASKRVESIADHLEKVRADQRKKLADKERKLEVGHELKQGILKTVKVHVALRRNLQVGDKMAGRHGNKGVVSKIVPAEDMPYLPDGTPVDIVLSPLGVPSRMNIGQILETHLGLAARGLGWKIEKMLRAERDKAVKSVRAFLDKIYNKGGGGETRLRLDDYDDEALLELARNLSGGVPFATPIFDGAGEDDIRGMLRLADMPDSGQMTLRDGRTGEAFARPVTVGYAYIMKLHHLVDDKMHARSTGPYSLVTQQPLGGKAQKGGQRFGEMEVWALEAYGAAHSLREMLTVKSDDIAGRAKIFENIVDGNFQSDSNLPESFNVLVHEIKGLGIEMKFE